MATIDHEHLSDEFALAIAHTPVPNRPRMASFLAFDQRIARIVSQSTEPMLAQIRIAWWRDNLAQKQAIRPQGDAVLDALGEHWTGAEPALISMLDGWEELLVEPPIEQQAIERFVNGRSAPFLEIGELETDSKSYRAVNQAGRIWAIADLASKSEIAEEREMLIEMGLRNDERSPPLPHSWRGLAVLAALGRRSLKSGGQPLMAGRGASWTAFCAALLRR